MRLVLFLLVLPALLAMSRVQKNPEPKPVQPAAPPPAPVAETSPVPGHDRLQVLRWQSAVMRPERLPELRKIADRILAAASRYQGVADRTGVPWYVIAGLHNMESGGSFAKHLHEGSPLTGRTRWVPKGRPKTGTPPFTWEVSAYDALTYDRMGSKNWRRLGPMLSACEGFNGWGYARYRKDVPSPYLWAGTTVYTRGKYVSDGKYSSTAVSAQMGVAPIWKELERRKLITLPPA